MAMRQREKDIKLLVSKFIKLVESLEPGERLSIKKIAPKKTVAGKSTGVKPRSGKGATKTSARRSTR